MSLSAHAWEHLEEESLMRMRVLTVLAVAAMVSMTPGVAAAGSGHGGGGHGAGGADDGRMRNRHEMDDAGHGKRHKITASTTPGAREIAVSAKSFAFKPARITLAADEDVTIALTSRDILHDFVVEGEGHIVAAKGTKTKRGGLRVDEPGTYKFWCSVSGHRRAGMEGTVVVQ